MLLIKRIGKNILPICNSSYVYKIDYLRPIVDVVVVLPSASMPYLRSIIYLSYPTIDVSPAFYFPLSCILPLSLPVVCFSILPSLETYFAQQSTRTVFTI